jgi:outer membrane protein OmpA-like peptidoglycan-associated protein
MSTKKLLSIASVVLAAAFFVSSCSSWSKATKGTMIGAGGGAAVGAVVGKTLGNTAAGAIAGAAVGGVAGNIIGRRMDRKAQRMEEEMEGVTIQRVEEGIAVSFDSGLLFDFDSADLRPEARDNLNKLTKIINRDDDTMLMIVGHTDSKGSESYNKELSEKRAEAAAGYMVSQGLSNSRIETEGRGESEPIGDNDTEEGRQDNRRIEVAIYASPAYVDSVQAANN